MQTVSCRKCGGVKLPRIRCQSQACYSQVWRKANGNAQRQAAESNAARIGNGYVPTVAIRAADEQLRVRRGN